MRLVFIFWCLLLICSSCRKEEKSTNANETKIDNDLIIYMADTGTGLLLDTRTKKDYPCVNYPIIYSLDKSGRTITVHYQHVLEGDKCMTAFGPAKTTVNIGGLESAEYTLLLKCNEMEQALSLTVTNDKYSLTNTSGKFFSFINTEVLR